MSTQMDQLISVQFFDLAQSTVEDLHLLLKKKLVEFRTLVTDLEVEVPLTKFHSRIPELLNYLTNKSYPPDEDTQYYQQFLSGWGESNGLTLTSAGFLSLFLLTESEGKTEDTSSSSSGSSGSLGSRGPSYQEVKRYVAEAYYTFCQLAEPDYFVANQVRHRDLLVSTEALEELLYNINVDESTSYQFCEYFGSPTVSYDRFLALWVGLGLQLKPRTFTTEIKDSPEEPNIIQQVFKELQLYIRKPLSTSETSGYTLNFKKFFTRYIAILFPFFFLRRRAHRPWLRLVAILILSFLSLMGQYIVYRCLAIVLPLFNDDLFEDPVVYIVPLVIFHSYVFCLAWGRAREFTPRFPFVHTTKVNVLLQGRKSYRLDNLYRLMLENERITHNTNRAKYSGTLKRHAVIIFLAVVVVIAGFVFEVMEVTNLHTLPDWAMGSTADSGCTNSICVAGSDPATLVYNYSCSDVFPNLVGVCPPGCASAPAPVYGGIYPTDGGPICVFTPDSPICKTAIFCGYLRNNSDGDNFNYSDTVSPQVTTFSTANFTAQTAHGVTTTPLNGSTKVQTLYSPGPFTGSFQSCFHCDHLDFLRNVAYFYAIFYLVAQISPLKTMIKQLHYVKVIKDVSAITFRSHAHSSGLWRSQFPHLPLTSRENIYAWLQWRAYVHDLMLWDTSYLEPFLIFRLVSFGVFVSPLIYFVWVSEDRGPLFYVSAPFALLDAIFLLGSFILCYQYNHLYMEGAVQVQALKTDLSLMDKNRIERRNSMDLLAQAEAGGGGLEGSKKDTDTENSEGKSNEEHSSSSRSHHHLLQEVHLMLTNKRDGIHILGIQINQFLVIVVAGFLAVTIISFISWVAQELNK